MTPHSQAQSQDPSPAANKSEDLIVEDFDSDIALNPGGGASGRNMAEEDLEEDDDDDECVSRRSSTAAVADGPLQAGGQAVKCGAAGGGEHKWRHDQCMICPACGECTGYGAICVSAGRPNRYGRLNDRHLFSFLYKIIDLPRDLINDPSPTWIMSSFLPATHSYRHPWEGFLR